MATHRSLIRFLVRWLSLAVFSTDGVSFTVYPEGRHLGDPSRISVATLANFLASISSFVLADSLMTDGPTKGLDVNDYPLASRYHPGLNPASRKEGAGGRRFLHSGYKAPEASPA